MAQQIVKEVDGSFQSFFGLLKLAKQEKYAFKDGYTTLVIGFVRGKNPFLLSVSNPYKKTHKPVEMNIPPVVLDKKVKEIRIIPKAKTRLFEIQYSYEAESMQRNINKNKVLALGLGVNNLVTAVSSTGKTVILGGKRLQAIPPWYNKQNA